MKRITLLSLFFLSLLSCSTDNIIYQITVENPLDIDRNSETITIPYSKITENSNISNDMLCVVDKQTGEYLLKQFADTDLDGTIDELIFQSNFKAGETKQFQVIISDSIPDKLSDPEVKAYGRFAPERTDDFTWENDKVAFRIYGPKAQQMVEAGEPGGTLSSGVDCWLKKVPYSVIDKWYAGYTTDPMYYHVDRGEGYDPYHVGGSLGCGGIGIFKNCELFTSKNYTDFKIIANGPVRFIFEVGYEPWMADEKLITYKKRISIDLGSNLTKQEIIFTDIPDSTQFAVGITLHEKNGVISADSTQGYFSYWEPMGESELGTGIVINPEQVNSYNEYIVDTPDKSHLFVFTSPIENKIEYYSGFGWKEAGDFKNNEEWNLYLSDFSKRLKSPLVIK